MASKDGTYEDERGTYIWRTVGGRKIKIYTGQSLSEAMIESGKFKNLRSSYKKAKQEDAKKETENEKVKNALKNDKKDFKINAVEDTGGGVKVYSGEIGDYTFIASEDGIEYFDKEQGMTLDKYLSLEEDAYTGKYGEDIKGAYDYEQKYAKFGVVPKDVEKEIMKKVSGGENDTNYLKDAFKKEEKTELNGEDKVDNKLLDLLKKQKELEQNDSISDDEFYALDEKISNEIANNYSAKEIERAEKQLEEKSAKELDEELRAKEDNDTKKTNWRDDIKKNNEQLEKDLKEYQDTHDMSRESEGYYELFRENERRNAKIKQEEPDDKYEFVEAYATYKDKRDKLEGIEKDELGNRNYDTMKDATWTGKEYTNDEFLENLEDENWHTERKMLLDAGLTNKQMEFVKNHTTFHNGSPSLDKEITEELIKGAKGEKYRTPDEIKENRNALEIESLQKSLDTISQKGRYDENGNQWEDVHGYTNYGDLKDRYKQLTGKDYDDSKIEIPYDPKKTYTYPNGTKIDQDLMKERYSGENPEKVKSDIDFNKSYLMNYNPKDRELHNAEIKEMEKYYDSMEKYESRISDDFGTKEWEDGYGQGAWKGSNYNPNMTTTEIAKAVTDKMKEAYPDVKLSRKSSYYSGGSSAHFNIMESDKPLIRNINDFSDSEIERLYNSGYNKNYYSTKEEFKESLRKDLESGHLNINQYNVSDDYRLTPYGKAVVKDMNKVINSYNFDDSDSQTDYFHTNFYDSISIGKSDKPYKVNETMNDKIREKASKKRIEPDSYKDAMITARNDDEVIKELEQRKETLSNHKDRYTQEEYKKQEDGLNAGIEYAKQQKSKIDTNKSMNDKIRTGANKYKSTKHEGFGDYNNDYVPVYNNKIDYTGDFSRADLTKLSSKELQDAINVQTSELEKANSERIGDQRTRNGKMDKIFNTARKQQYSEGVRLLKEEAIRRENEKYPQYKGTDAEVKYYSVKDAMDDPNSKMNQFIRNEKEKKAFKKYQKIHPDSKMTFEEFKKR